MFGCSTNAQEQNLSFDNEQINSLMKKSFTQLKKLDKQNIYDRFYIMQQADTIIVLNVNVNNTLPIILLTNKKSCFNYGEYQIGVLEKEPKYKLLNFTATDQCKNDYPAIGMGNQDKVINGIIYKISKKNKKYKFSIIEEGNLYPFFEKHSEYHTKKVPIPEPISKPLHLKDN